MRRSRAAVTACLVAAAVGVTGCATLPPGAPARAVDAIRCVSDFSSDESVQPPPAGEVPAGFDATAAYRCDTTATEADETGMWAGVRIVRLEGDLRPLLAALAEPDEPPGFVCSAVGFVVPDLWLADDEGGFVRIAYPAAACGPRTEDVDAALSLLTEVEDRFERSMLLESTAATAAGCATYADALVLVGPSASIGEGVPATLDPEDSNLIPFEPPAPPDPADVDGMLVCAYEGGAAVGAGSARYTVARALDRERAQALLRALGPNEEADRACLARASRLVIVHPLVDGTAVASLTIELDGCRRIIDPSLRASFASDILLALVSQP